ncbi:hypothetical protein D3C73_1506130 [compost metagenome]
MLFLTGCLGRGALTGSKGMGPTCTFAAVGPVRYFFVRSWKRAMVFCGKLIAYGFLGKGL